MAFQSSGPITGYRIADSRFPLFDGGGAAQFGGRWNSPGRRVIYGSLSFAGALLEQLARAQLRLLPKTQSWISFHIPEECAVETVSAAELANWDAKDYQASREYGDQWYDDNRTIVLLVPSVVGRPVEQNLIINHSHPDFYKIAVAEAQPVLWDDRLGR